MIYTLKENKSKSDNMKSIEEKEKPSKICRICHSDEDLDGSCRTMYFFRSESNMLISPCGCKGTMKYVHKICLNEWRTASPRSDSFYKCEQCFETYRFKAHCATLLMSSKWIIRGFSILMMLFLIWASSSIFESGKVMMMELGIEDDWNSMEYDYVTGDDYYYRNEEYKAYAEINKYNAPTKTTVTERAKTNANSKDSGKIEAVQKKHQTYHKPISDHPSDYSICWLPSLIDYSIPFYFTGCTILALLQFLLLSPNLNMAFNLLFSLWRIQKYEYKLDCALTLAFTVYGMIKLGLDLHSGIGKSVDRWIKMNLMDLVNK